MFMVNFLFSLCDVKKYYIRKKKLTCHWRNFIRPLMWRCKWTELRIKELELQALKYMREVEANDQTKSLESQHCTSDFCSKSFPFVNHSVKRKLMRRRKRKRVENVTDISSYMSHHQLFSYLGIYFTVLCVLLFIPNFFSYDYGHLA